MKEIFNNNNTGSFRRLFAVGASSCMLAVALTGCFGGDEVPETIPVTEPPILLETEPVETTEATLPLETQPAEAAPNVTVDGKIVTITGAPVEVRSAVGADGLVMGKLEVGSQSEILRQVELDGVNWALVREGWICLDNIDLDSMITDDDEDDEDITVVPDDKKDDDIQKPHRPSMDGVESAEGPTTQLNKKGVVTANGLNVRSEPSTTAKVVDSLKKGEWINVIEKKGDWGHIQNGWISLKYVNFNGGTNNNDTQTETNNGTVIARGIVNVDGLNIRSGAGTNNNAVGTYNTGDRVEIFEKTTVGDATWGKTSKGWIALGYVYMDGTRSDNVVNGTVTGDVVNVRSGPGTGYKVVASVSQGDSVEVLAQFKIGNTTWGCLKNGWISMDFVKTAD